MIMSYEVLSTAFTIHAQQPCDIALNFVLDVSASGISEYY